VIAGINFVASDSQTRTGCAGKSVANLSLGGSKSDAVNTAAANAVAAGVFMAVAAGNSGVDASTASPASESTVCTIGAIDASTDLIASFSNWGTVVDLYAPGVNIKSTWNDGTTVSSLSAPHPNSSSY